jgi:hypothetical protein
MTRVKDLKLKEVKEQNYHNAAYLRDIEKQIGDLM